MSSQHTPPRCGGGRAVGVGPVPPHACVCGCTCTWKPLRPAQLCSSPYPAASTLTLCPALAPRCPAPPLNCRAGHAPVPAAQDEQDPRGDGPAAQHQHELLREAGVPGGDPQPGGGGLAHRRDPAPQAHAAGGGKAGGCQQGRALLGFSRCLGSLLCRTAAIWTRTAWAQPPAAAPNIKASWALSLGPPCCRTSRARV